MASVREQRLEYSPPKLQRLGTMTQLTRGTKFGAYPDMDAEWKSVS